MRREAALSDVKVILVEPGGIRTPMVEHQLRGVAQDKTTRSEEESSLYGDMFDNFLRLAGEGYEANTMLDPAVVAQTVVNALQTESPKARYQIGDDSVFLCDLARKTDEEIDATMMTFWSQ